MNSSSENLALATSTQQNSALESTTNISQVYTREVVVAKLLQRLEDLAQESIGSKFTYEPKGLRKATTGGDGHMEAYKIDLPSLPRRPSVGFFKTLKKNPLSLFAAIKALGTKPSSLLVANGGLIIARMQPDPDQQYQRFWPPANADKALEKTDFIEEVVTVIRNAAIGRKQINPSPASQGTDSLRHDHARVLPFQAHDPSNVI